MVENSQSGKEKVKHFVKQHPQIIVFTILAIIILFGFFARLQNLNMLKDVTTGQYVTLELDSEIWSRYAQYIVEHGSLFSVDPMRFVPLGADLSNIGLGTAYFIAWFYQFLHIFNPTMTVQLADLLYPPLMMAVMSLFLFLLLRRLFNCKVGLLAVTIIQFLPSFLFRSISSDHDMLAMALIIATFYFYVAAWQSKNTRNALILSFISGLTTICAYETAGSSNFIFVILGAFVLIETILNKFNSKDYYIYSIWIFMSTLGIFLDGGFTLIKSTLSSLMGMMPYIGFVSGTIFFLVYDKNVLNLKSKLEKIKLPEGITSLLITLFLGIIIAILIFGFDFFVQKISEISHILFHLYSENRWTLTVAENKKPYVTDWFGQFGETLIFAMIAGSILLFHKAVKEIDKKKYLSISYGVFIFIYIFSRYAQDSIFDGTSTISRITFYGSLLGFAAIVIYAFLKTYYKQKEHYTKISEIDKKYAFILVWFIIMIVAATSAIRLLYEFTPIAVILSSYFLIEVYDYFRTKNLALLKYIGLGILSILLFLNSLTIPALVLLALVVLTYLYDNNGKETENRIHAINYLGIATLILILFSPFSFAYGAVTQDYLGADNQLKYMGPGYNQQWQNAGKFVRDNTPKTAVFAHWWDYGYWVQSEFQRATVGDGGNFIGWWNYLMGRKVLTGQSGEESLPFLYSHNATNLLIVQDDIGKYTAYSSIGSDEKNDRFSYILPFSMNNQYTKETRNGTEIYYQGSFALDENLIFNNQLYPAGKSGVVAVKLSFTSNSSDPSTPIVNQPTIILASQTNQQELTLKCLSFNNKIYEFPKADYDGCFRVVPVIQDASNINSIGAGYFLSTRTYHSNVGQLYILGKDSPYFKLVYDDSAQYPLAVYQGRQIGPIKIWQINYPSNFSITKDEFYYNTRLDYPNQSLLTPIN